MKCINYLSLLRFSLLLPNCEGLHSVFIYKFKYKNFNTHASMDGPPHPNMPGGGGESFKMAALLLEGYEKLELSYNSGYESRVTLPYIHNDTGAFEI